MLYRMAAVRKLDVIPLDVVVSFQVDDNIGAFNTYACPLGWK
jgi:hypothetical protein